METVDLLVTNASELLTLQGPNAPRVQEQMRKLSIIKKGSVAVKHERIIAVGRTLRYKAKKTIDATGKLVMPGFVDPHTHAVFAGSREFELDLKLAGISYMEILKRGGGIFYTVEQTRKASFGSLMSQTTTRLNSMLSYGTTTCEMKTGYGLDVQTELKLLKVHQKLEEKHPMDIVSTFLGAHAVPRDQKSDQYVRTIIDEMLPKVKGFAEFCDVFCERGCSPCRRRSRSWKRESSMAFSRSCMPTKSSIPVARNAPRMSVRSVRTIS